MTIHPTAQVSPHAQLGEGVQIGAFSMIHANVVLGDHTQIGAYCEMGVPAPLGDGSALKIGAHAQIRSHAIFYEASSFGAGLVTGHRVTVREHTRCGIGVQMGSTCDIQGDCSIGDYVRMQSHVFVGKKTNIGHFVWLLPYVVLTNDPTPPSDVLQGCTLEDFVSVCACAVILPMVRVGTHAVVAAHACVTKDVLPHMLVAGVPAKAVGPAKKVCLRDGSGRPAYPWTAHFERGYPEAARARWAHAISAPDESSFARRG